MSETEDSVTKGGGVAAEGGALNSLRNFRLQKKKFSGSNTDGATGSSFDALSPQPLNSSQGSSMSDSEEIRPAGYKRVLSDSPASEETGNGSSHKRMRILSDSESENGSPEKKIQTEVDQLEKKLSFLKNAFPNRDPMELQDVLKNCNWNVDTASAQLSSISSDKKSPGKQAKGTYINSRVKAHEANEENSESDDDEFSGRALVYDSDEEEEGPSNERMTPDKRKVLKFFNEGTDSELIGIQGCNKKKVQEILRLRPFENWVDLVTKIQTNRQLNTEMLNSATELLRMKSTVTKLMNKCQKITEKMEGMVEQLTTCAKSRLELQEQPKMINSDMKLTMYQMIGLNWLVLMHKQSLNGILADEMGLGKTIQTIAFLAHLKESGDEGPHLIIVPSSTLENWRKEFALWAPDLVVQTYWGSQDERRHLRLQLVQDELEYDIILTTYNMVISSPEDRVLFKKMEFVYVVFDEAHMLKNMASQRYEQLMKVRCCRKLLLTGTPLQNNLVELMSLLIFVMPGMFAKRKDQLKKMFSLFPKNQDDNERSRYEQDRIAHAKRIMKPFFLRRLKADVLTDLPDKVSTLERVPMTQRQSQIYFQLVADYKARAARIEAGEESAESGIGMLMNLRKTANHPLLIRDQYTDKQLELIARLLKTKDAGHKNALEEYIIQDLKLLSDFDIHKTCETYRCIEHLSLGNHLLCESGKFQLLDDLLPQMRDAGDRVLIFSQFTMLLDILQRYLKIRGHKFLRLDGQTPVQERQTLIDEFNNDPSIFIFILSTRAGGLGINLTAANTVILHDLDFNPYNDKQAEDRCHRVGQTKEVKVIRFTSEGTIEEGIHSIAMDKLKLEQDVTGEEKGDSSKKKKDVARLLKTVLGVELKEQQIGDVGKVYTEL
ncbi:SWI/SNF-related matrix-associated actin-dependent regulator of chromatin subfamily A containing DEAD/H box 1 homolog isoform X3 [Eurytemora carolleeae]|uniref:SWI/SNF-related matrix-associated actin-dependent regulator of chromatin subfamily A containing DEAD/H box 1 homolog isoform X3 n=1 Tax=Eurytemora carolleeae TaxID=1294199 RepID=UPI000C7856AD|nr:SWI/SNF-related matrix-associated actin-dependent regulator of chromatin subfamily A containing DEAD/H box 1 homolog isoform X3 [Eurytemora carolleeae]|eukprot:XP_023339390.1 SWI/SNF-related matrix-associated actin-dependent regulator of chromatin subfamily A containing DEAD/H box 1 homolog isoform X3 [Eurytemora affinis]